MRTVGSLLVVLGVLVLVSGCASKQDIANMSLGEEQVVERIPDPAPEWLNMPYEESGERLLFKGEASRGSDVSLCLRQSKANAVQNLVEAINVKGRSEFSEAVRGVNVSEAALGRYLDSVIAWTSENIQVSGIVTQDEYREKVQVRTYEGVSYYYNCVSRLSVPVESYQHARQAALTRAVVEAQDDEAKALALEAKARLAP